MNVLINPILSADTDSFIIRVKTNNFYSDWSPAEIQQHFDTSGYSPEKLKEYGYQCVNKKELGKFKDEINGGVISCFVGLRSKVYAISAVNSAGVIDTKTRAKGVSKSIVKRYSMQQYMNVLTTSQPLVSTMYRIQTKLQQLYTVKVTKIALSIGDDKRYRLHNDSYETLPWGHKSIAEEERRYQQDQMDADEEHRPEPMDADDGDSD